MLCRGATTQLRIRAVTGALLLFALAACAAPPPPRTVYVDPASRGTVGGVGVESNDLLSMTDEMMRDMLAAPSLFRRPSPRVIVDGAYFENEGATRLNVNLITDRLRVELNRAARGRMTFVGRHLSEMVRSERAMKRSGAVTSGEGAPAPAPAGADFRLGGRVTTLDAVNPTSGVRSRTHQIVFEMIDLETGVLEWSGMYTFRKESLDDVIYR